MQKQTYKQINQPAEVCPEMYTLACTHSSLLYHLFLQRQHAITHSTRWVHFSPLPSFPCLILLAFSLFCFVFTLFFLVSVVYILPFKKEIWIQWSREERKTQDNNLIIHEKCYRRKYCTDLLLCLLLCVENLSTLLTCYKRLKFSFWQKVLTSSSSSSREHELCKTGAMKKILVLHQNFLLHWHPKGWPMSWNFPSRQLLERTDEDWNRLCSPSDQRA